MDVREKSWASALYGRAKEEEEEGPLRVLSKDSHVFFFVKTRASFFS